MVARARGFNTYDAGRPTDDTVTVKDQITGTTGAQLRVHPTVHAKTRETRTVYDWARGLATQTVQDPGGLAITTVTQYDEQGRVTKEIWPGSPAARRPRPATGRLRTGSWTARAPR
ncbi:hypothetical protein AQJ46_50220 [Streptomyces canus]|uniref:Uncharacterized protein n=1 Tax=Streptomyces canus TaxID=58343 RepID=A0A101RJX3_9ACTN|nr:hypothetical protein [Streptomyces canus]KUN53463.1 hypothetical protein AQJ46_50220 [Streptomyces canus]